MSQTRREFLGRTSALTAGAMAAATLPNHLFAKGVNKSANEKMVAALIGCKGMGMADLKAFLEQPNTECAALCDVDENVLNERIADVEKIQGKKCRDCR